MGCGDGLIDRLILDRRPDLTISAIDVTRRPEAHVPVGEYDGRNIPYDDGDMDMVMFVDVLHHVADPTALLREARRVARQGIVLKDHNRDGVAAALTLRLMDWIGNAPHGVASPGTYWPRARWRRVFRDLGLEPVYERTDLGLYPRPMRWIFERSLHFVARLEPTDRPPTAPRRGTHR